MKKPVPKTSWYPSCAAACRFGRRSAAERVSKTRVWNPSFFCTSRRPAPAGRRAPVRRGAGDEGGADGGRVAGAGRCPRGGKVLGRRGAAEEGGLESELLRHALARRGRRLEEALVSQPDVVRGQAD